MDAAEDSLELLAGKTTNPEDFEICHGSSCGCRVAVGDQTALIDRQRLDTFVVVEGHLELAAEVGVGPADLDQKSISHQVKLLAVHVRSPVWPRHLNSLRRGGFFANKESGMGITYRPCSTWAAWKSRRCGFGSVFLKIWVIRELILPRGPPHVSVGWVNGEKCGLGNDGGVINRVKVRPRDRGTFQSRFYLRESWWLAACEPLCDDGCVLRLHAHHGPYPRIGQEDRSLVSTNACERDDLPGMFFGTVINSKIEILVETSGGSLLVGVPSFRMFATRLVTVLDT